MMLELLLLLLLLLLPMLHMSTRYRLHHTAAPKPNEPPQQQARRCDQRE
jgi:hypothetical protein